MRKTSVLMAVIMLTVLASTAMADPGGDGKAVIETKAGTLFLFQKCQLQPLVEGVGGVQAFDVYGCPTVPGPWPILPTNRWGQMKYNLLGDKFKFSFEGKKLVPNTKYTLIYYPDPYPGENLICLGSRKSNGAGNLQINGSREITTGLPTPDDANFLPQDPPGSGAVGAKIWLVLSADVDCEGTPAKVVDPSVAPVPHMTGWTPQDYLFEGNLIVYQYQPTN
jgi:hypothetical protein